VKPSTLFFVAALKARNPENCLSTFAHFFFFENTIAKFFFQRRLLLFHFHDI